MTNVPQNNAGKPANAKRVGPYGNSGGKKGRSGAPRQNRNNLRHGLRAGQLPVDSKYIEHRLNNFRRQLEDAVLACRGDVTLVDAAAIQTCLRWERHGCLCQRWLNKQYKELKPLERLHFSREIARASAERDKALATLNLDNKPEVIDLKGYIDVKGNS